MYYQDLAVKLKERHPEYKDVDNRELVNRYISAKPQYRNRVTFDKPAVINNTIVNKTNNATATKPVNTKNISEGMRIAQDNTLSKEEKVKRIDAIHQAENEANSVENLKKQYAQNKINEINARKQAHPFIHGMNAMFNPVAGANDYYLQKIAENGQVGAGDIAKMAGMGLLTGVGDALSVTGLGSIAKGAQGVNAIKAAKAADLALKAKNAGNIQRATQLAQMSNNLNKAEKIGNIARTSGQGAVTFAAPVAGEQYGQALAGNETFGEATKETAIAAGEGAVLGNLGKVVHAGTSKLMNKSAEDAVKFILEKQGKTPSKELVDKFISEHPYLYPALIEGGVNTAKALPATAVDTAALGTMDYGLNTFEGTQEQPYLEHMKNFAPFLFMGGIPAALGGAKATGRAIRNIPAIQKAEGAIGNFVEKNPWAYNSVGTAADAMNLKVPEGSNMEAAANIERAKQGIANAEKGKLPELQNSEVLNESLKYDTKRQNEARDEAIGKKKPEEPKTIEELIQESVFGEKEPVAEEIKQNVPDGKKSIKDINSEFMKVESEPLPNENIKQDVTNEVVQEVKRGRGRPKGSKNKPKTTEAPLTKENESVGINTPKEDLTHVNEPSTASEKYSPNENAEPIVKTKKPEVKVEEQPKIVKQDNTITPKQATQKTVEGSVEKAKAKKVYKGKLIQPNEDFKNYKVIQEKAQDVNSANFINKDRTFGEENIYENVETPKDIMVSKGRNTESRSYEGNYSEKTINSLMDKYYEKDGVLYYKKGKKKDTAVSAKEVLKLRENLKKEYENNKGNEYNEEYAYNKYEQELSEAEEKAITKDAGYTDTLDIHADKEYDTTASSQYITDNNKFIDFYEGYKSASKKNKEILLKNYTKNMYAKERREFSELLTRQQEHEKRIVLKESEKIGNTKDKYEEAEKLENETDELITKLNDETGIFDEVEHNFDEQGKITPKAEKYVYSLLNNRVYKGIQQSFKNKKLDTPIKLTEEDIKNGRYDYGIDKTGNHNYKELSDFEKETGEITDRKLTEEEKFKTYIKEKLNAHTKSGLEKQYNEFYEAVNRLPISDNLKEHIIKKANDLISNNEKVVGKINLKNYKASEEQLNAIKQLEKLDKEGKYDEGRKLINEHGLRSVKDARKALANHYQLTVGKTIKYIDSLIKQGKLAKARKVWNENKKLIRNDIIQGFREEASVYDEARARFLDDELKNKDIRNYSQYIEVKTGKKKEFVRENSNAYSSAEAAFQRLSDEMDRRLKVLDKSKKYIKPAEVQKPFKDINRLDNIDTIARQDSNAKYKLFDYIDDITDGLEAKPAVKGFARKHLADLEFNFDKMSSDTNAYYKNNRITINSNLHGETLKDAIRHELHHAIWEKMTKILGEDHPLTKIWNDRIELANKQRGIELKYPEIAIDKNKLFEINNTKELTPEQNVWLTKWYKKAKTVVDKKTGKTYLDIVNDYAKLEDGYIKHEVETSANTNEFKFNGKDLKDYAEEIRQSRAGNTPGSSDLVKKAEQRTSVVKSRTDGTSSNDGQKLLSEGQQGRIESKKPFTSEVFDKIFNKFKQQEEAVEFNHEKFKQYKQEYKYTLRKLSKKLERDKIKLLGMTRKMFKNRLKQMNAEFYAPNPSRHFNSEGIDITRDYNEGRNKKVGLFGKAKHDLPNADNPGYDSLREMYVQDAKLEHLKTIDDSIEKLSTPVEKGIKTGYYDKNNKLVAVNKVLLNNTIWNKYSKEFVETINSGKYQHLAKDADQLAYLDDLYKSTRKADFMIPEKIYSKLLDGAGENIRDYVERYGKSGRTGAILKKVASEALNISNDFFKRRVLGTASFFVNNRMGNQLMIMANSDNPIDYVKSWAEAKKISYKDVPIELLENSIAEAFENATSRRTYTGYNATDNVINLLKGVDIDLTKIKPGVKRNIAWLANKGIALPNKVYNKVADSILDYNTRWEDFERKQLFAQQVNKVRKDLIKTTGRRMITTEEVIKHINKTPALRETVIRNIQDVLGDYSNFSKFERKCLKSIIPFYSWFRTISRHTIQLARKNPSRFGLIAWQMKKMADEDEDLKEYQRGLGNIRLPIKDPRSGKQLVINKVAQIPWNTFGELLSPNSKFSAIASIPRAVTEAIRGRKWFNDSEITNKRYYRIEKNNKNKNNKKEYYYYDSKTGEYIDKLPVSTRVGYVGKEILRDLNPLIFNNTTNLESVWSGIDNKIKKGEYLEQDKSYDASLGGFRSGDSVGYTYNKYGKRKDFERYAANNISKEAKFANRFLGLSLANKTELNKDERKALEDEKIKRQQKKMKNKRKKAS